MQRATTPHDFQAGAIDHHADLINARGASIEGSVAGFGKTFVAAFVAKRLGMPLVVACPKVVIPHWKHACELVGAPFRSISNYEQHKLGHTGTGVWKIKNRQWSWTLPKPSLLVFDEAHYLKERTSQNAKLAIAAKRQGIPTLLMSATLAQDPLDLYTAGFCAGIHSGDTYDFLAWAQRYGVRRGRFDWEFDRLADPKALDRLHSFLFPTYGHRKTYSDIPGFPDEVTEALAVDIGSAVEDIESAWMRIQELEGLKAESITAVTDRLRARQISELAKVPAIVDLAKEYISNGQSVPIFVNFKDTLNELAKAFPKFPVIRGSQSDLVRASGIAAFQSDQVRGIILQIQAGGVGISLHDTNGVYPRHSIISPPESARDLIQSLGRTRRVGGKSPAFRTILFAEGTIEEKVRRKVEAKAGQIELINDGTLDPLSP